MKEYWNVPLCKYYSEQTIIGDSVLEQNLHQFANKPIIQNGNVIGVIKEAEYYNLTDKILYGNIVLYSGEEKDFSNSSVEPIGTLEIIPKKTMLVISEFDVVGVNTIK